MGSNVGDSVDTMRSVHLSILVPVRDEEGSLQELHRRLRVFQDSLPYTSEVIFIENGSRDKTLDILKSLTGVRILALQSDDRARKPMKAAAIKAGIDHARGEIIASIDGDLQEDPEELSKLLSALDAGADFVVARRNQRSKYSSKLITSTGNVLRRALGFTHVHDAGCGMRAWKRACLEHVALFGEWDRFIPDIVALNGWKVEEVPVSHQPRRNGRSKYPWTKALRALIDLLGLWWWKKYGDRPLQGFGLAAVLVLGIGIIISLFAGFAIVALAIVISVQLFAMGLFFDELTRRYYVEHTPYRICEIIETKGE